MKPHASARSLVSDRGGSAAVEFALVGPVFFILLFGILQLGWAFHCASSVQYALERASRTVMLDESANEDDVREVMTNFLDNVASTDFEIALSDSTINGVEFVRLQSTYNHVVDIPFVPTLTLQFSSVQIAQRPDDEE